MQAWSHYTCICIDYPTPSNRTHWWGFGSLAGICLVLWIVNGVFSMHHHVLKKGINEVAIKMDRICETSRNSTWSDLTVKTILPAELQVEYWMSASDSRNKRVRFLFSWIPGLVWLRRIKSFHYFRLFLSFVRSNVYLTITAVYRSILLANLYLSCCYK